MRPEPTTLFVLGMLAMPAFAQSLEHHGEWPLDGLVPGVATDISGNSNDGTLVNFAASPWVPGMFGNALAFDGVDDYVSTALQSTAIYGSLGSPYSICFWVKAPPQQNKFVYAEGSTSTNLPIIVFGSPNNALTDRFRVLIRNAQNQNVMEGISNEVAFDNSWHHVTFVDNAGECSCYIDGILDSAVWQYNPGSGPGEAGYGTYPLNTATMGGLRRGTVCCNLTGEVDDLRIYKFAMTATDVAFAMAGAPLLPATASIGEFGVGCGAGPLDIVGGGSARIGGAGAQYGLSGGQPNSLALWAFAAGGIAPVDLGPVGFPGCTLYVANPITLFAGIVDAAGAVPPITLPIPNSPSLLMAQVTTQAAALVGSTLEFSDAVLATVAN